jgi:uncharacterized membrane protein YraQ (UPF0718 family)
MDFITRFATETWSMTTQLAPWLLLGFALAGIISVFVSRDLVTHYLGKPGLSGIVKATLVGVPMPLCSCGVIPVAAAIREKGASKGATAAFLASTPETGIDSAIATWGMLGPVMAVLRVCLAFVTGILAGLFVEFLTRGEKTAETPAKAEASVDASESKSEPADASCCASRETKAGGAGHKVAAALRYAFLTMPRDMAVSLTTGILLAALVSTLLPGDFFAGLAASGPLAYVVITLFAVPLYVCSTGSIPLAVAMVHSGFTPGGALVFLLSGPATNAATITTMRRYLGTRAIVGYLAAIVLTAWTAGYVVDAGVGREAIIGQMPHQMAETGPFGVVTGIGLALMILAGLLARLTAGIESRQAGAESCHCGPKTPVREEKDHCCCHKKNP